MRAVILCLGLMLASAVQAADLLEIYRAATLQDQVFLAAGHVFEGAGERVEQARAGLLPTLSLNGNSGRQAGRASFSEAPYENREARNRSWSLQLTQPLFRWASVAAYRQADAQARQAEAQFAQARQDLILRVVQAYFDVMVARESIVATEAQLLAVEQQLVLAKRNYDVGAATITDVHEAKSRHDLTHAQRIAATNELEAKRSELDRIVGSAPDRLTPLRADTMLPEPSPNVPEHWVTQARSAHPQVRIAEAGEEAAEREVEKQRSAHWPTLDWTASAGNNYASGSISSPADIPVRHRSHQTGIQLNVPLFSGGATSARVGEAVAALRRARADGEAARRAAAAQARQAFAGVTNGQAQVAALESAVASSRQSVEANKVGYRTGTRINVDVLNAEQQLYAAQRDLVKARYEALLQGLRLKAAVGILGEADVVALNQLLDSVLVPIAGEPLAVHAVRETALVAGKKEE